MKTAETYANRKKRLKKYGLCVQCGEKSRLNKVLCQPCAEKQTSRRQKRHLTGKCTDCGKTPPRHGKKQCQECASKSANSRLRSIKNERRRADWVRRIVNRMKEQMGCSICGYNKCGVALDWHHRDPKEKEIKSSKFPYVSWPEILHEIDKCICVCANCHREFHFNLKIA